MQIVKAMVDGWDRLETQVRYEMPEAMSQFHGL